MSKIGFLVNGGMEGIEVSRKELELFSDKLGNKYLDQVIPLPDVSLEEQKIRINHCPDHDQDDSYWETETGSHGWCCSHCGTVTQWG
jgi:hypothetical protein